MAAATSTLAPGESELAAEQEAPASSPADRAARLGVGVAIVAGIGLRAWLAWGSELGRVDPDEAVSGLMARQLLHGHHPAFFWGQSYGGTAEEALIAAVFRVTGSNAAALKVVPVACGLVGIWLTWRIGRRLLGNRAGAVAAGLAAIWPLGSAYWSTRARGFYGVTLVLVLTATLLAVRLRGRAGDEGPRSTTDLRDWLLLGLCAGVAWWSTPLSILVLAPVAVWLLVGRRPSIAALGLVLVGGAVGSAPWLVWNLGHQWGSLTTPPQGLANNGYLDHLHTFVVRGIPLLLGLQAPWHPAWLFGPVVGPLAAVVLVGLLAWGAARAGRRALLLAAVLLAYPFLLALTPYAWFLDDTRYLYLAMPVVALLAAAALDQIGPHWRSRAAVAGLAVAIALTALGLPKLATRHEVDVAPLARALESHHLTHVGADYSVAYPLMFATDERIVATPLAGSVRSRSIARQVRDAPRVAMVWETGSARQRSLDRRLAAGTLTAEDRFTAAGFTVVVLDHRQAAPLIHV